ncbi:hypothetical protein Slin15195_G005680 [Septoria linicola]|uniref:Uncharacterized protein n=1 Tax=Septoria linicola TaxID=215465 RepID=A0A9Q9EET0_9PEZI|nr:hypothetical protein Slin14017_G005720 [Septoria linicola]USW47249.1 hypothetical protein Slin15195_G005680 [Septoria linicola]
MTEGNNQMVSSPEESDIEEVSTPVAQISNPAATVLSPPDSQQRSMPTAASGASIANSNGKRPLQTGADDMEELQNMGNANGKAKVEPSFKTHESSGYTYNKAEDEPGYAWLNKKAQDESNRAWDGLQHKDHMVKGRYGDLFDAAAKEKAVLASLQQQ